MKTKLKTRSLTILISLTAIFIALSIVITCFIAIPIPGGQGYINISDSIIMLVASLIHPLVGAVVGSVSGAFSDLFLGYGVYAFATFFIKGLEGLMIGYSLRFLFKNTTKLGLFLVPVFFVLGGALMMTGYFFFELALFGPGLAFADLLPNFIQGTASALIASLLFYSLYRLPALRNTWISTNASFLHKMGS